MYWRSLISCYWIWIMCVSQNSCTYTQMSCILYVTMQRYVNLYVAFSLIVLYKRVTSHISWHGQRSIDSLKAGARQNIGCDTRSIWEWAISEGMSIFSGFLWVVYVVKECICGRNFRKKSIFNRMISEGIWYTAGYRWVLIYCDIWLYINIRSNITRYRMPLLSSVI